MNNETETSPDIFSATLTYVDGKLMLKSKEGWILWSGSAEQEYSLQAIIDRAAPILKIRSKRKK